MNLGHKPWEWLEKENNWANMRRLIPKAVSSRRQDIRPWRVDEKQFWVPEFFLGP